MTSAAPFSTDLPAVHTLAAAYRARFPTALPDPIVTYGYGVAKAYVQVLRKACARGDLTRQGVADAMLATTRIDTGGLLAPLDFSAPGAPATRKVYLSRPDAQTEGGLIVVQQLFEADMAAAYQAPAQG